MRRGACLLLLLSVLAADEREQVEARVHAVAKELAALGYEVDVEQVGIELRDPGDGVAGDPAPLTEDEQRVVDAFRLVVELGIGPTRAEPDDALGYYLPWRESISFARAPACFWSCGDGIVAHELVHAHQAQRRGLLARADRFRMTTDENNALRCLVEGEADLVAYRLLFARMGRSFADVPNDALHLARYCVDRTYVPYRLGMAYLHGLGSREAIDAAYAKLPSTRAILHPEASDDSGRPPIAWPADLPDGELLVEDCFGELGIQLWVGRRAGLGWRNDALRVYRTEDGEVVAWRSVWDRPEDAEQFARILRKRILGGVFTRGRDALWITSRPSTLQESWRNSLLRSMTPRTVIEKDAEATARREAALPPADREVDGRWVVGSLGVSLPVPPRWRVAPGWESSSLRDDRSGGRSGVIHVDLSPHAGSLDNLERRYRDLANELPWERAPICRRVEVDGRAGLLTLHAPIGWRLLRLHVPWRGGLLVASLRVHAGFLDEQWEPAREALLALEFDDR